MSPVIRYGTPLPAKLAVIAVQAEASGAFEAAHVPYLLCGVGKVNAAIALTMELARYAHAFAPMPTVYNFGTAGSRVHAAGTLVQCCEFIQRDMDARELGLPLGATPFDPQPAQISFEPVFKHLPVAVCGTGDSFAAGSAEFDCAVVDMEAYALAKVCKSFGADFACAKYVSDGADPSSAGDWQSNVHKAAEEFVRLFVGTSYSGDAERE